jgi:hypothetical protein
MAGPKRRPSIQSSSPQAPPENPPPLIDQLKPDGRMVIPGGASDMQYLLLLEKRLDGTTTMRPRCPSTPDDKDRSTRAAVPKDRIGQSQRGATLDEAGRAGRRIGRGWTFQVVASRPSSVTCLSRRRFDAV